MAEQAAKPTFAGRTAKEASALDSSLEWAISEKGAVSVYGVGRWPVTLYAGTWRRLLAGCEEVTGPSAELLEFISNNEEHLAEPPDARRGAKPKSETFNISPADTISIGQIADSLAGSATTPDERKYVANLMSIKATAEMSSGKVTFEQLAFAKGAIANHAKPAPNAANAGKTTE